MDMLYLQPVSRAATISRSTENLSLNISQIEDLFQLGVTILVNFDLIPPPMNRQLTG